MRLPRKITSHTPFATEWNAMVDYLRSLTPGLSNGVHMTRTPFGAVHASTMRARAAALGSSVYCAEIQSWTSTNDYASVKLATYNESTNAWDDSGDAFNAALPILQRQATKPASDHSDAVALLWPAYAANQIVLIAKTVGGTGVEVSSADLDWQILPNERSWCFEVPICTESDGTLYAIMPCWTMEDASNASFNPVD